MQKHTPKLATNREHSLVDMYIYCILSIYISTYDILLMYLSLIKMDLNNLLKIVGGWRTLLLKRGQTKEDEIGVP